MTREQAQVFVNKLERELISYVEGSDKIVNLDELDEALAEFDSAMMKIMGIIAEDA